MRTIEIRRHCFTKKGDARGKGSHLSAAGVAQARRIGAETGPFTLVVTSHIPRTLETAIAMGFAVDDQWDVFGDLPAAVWDEIGHQERWTWAAPFVQFAQVIAQSGATAALGQHQQQGWQRALALVPADGSVLIISHGRVIEAGLATCFPHAEFAAWGAPFQHGEGVRMQYEDEGFFNLQFLRQAPPQLT